MAALSTNDRLSIKRGLMRYTSRERETWSELTKDDIEAAVNATDDWADSNAASFNSALPVTFRNNATNGQKSLLLAVVILMRYNPTLLRALVGELD